MQHGAFIVNKAVFTRV